MNKMRYPSYKRPIEYINNKAYLIHAIYPIDRVKDANGIKEWLGVDTAFKSNRNGTYIFCEEIEEANIL
jgi:hypothetical protein